MPKFAQRTQRQGPYNARNLAAVVPRMAVLDFSFLDVENVDDLPALEPRHGVECRQRNSNAAGPASSMRSGGPAGKGSDDPNPSASGAWEFGNAGTGKTEKTGDGVFVLRAGEETYAFRDEEEMQKTKGVFTNDPDANKYELDADGNLVAKKQSLIDLAAEQTKRYHCNQLKLDNNKLSSAGVAALPTVLARLTVNPLINLTVIDLSFNQLTTVPALDAFPVHSLCLHCNAITTMKEIAKLQLLHKTLRKLTLNGNPVQERVKKFKYAVLHTLPFLQCFDDVRVTNKDRERIAVFEELFVPKQDRGTTRKFLPPLSPSPTPA